MTDETRDHPTPEEKPDLEETLTNVDKVRKQLRDDAQTISRVEQTARQDRIRFERAADDFDRTYINLTSLRGTPSASLPSLLFEINGMASSASVSGTVAGIAYQKIQPFLTDVRTLTPGIVASAGTAHYLSTEAYYEARQHDPSLPPEPPSSKYYPVYVEDAATPDQKELDFLLSGIAPHLADKLCGARTALASNHPDHIGQAYTSMQELLDQVLHHFSDDVVEGKDGRVKKACWFKPDPKDGVIRSHRVRFVVQGYALEVDPETERRIQQLIEQARPLSKIETGKHHHGPTEQAGKIIARQVLTNLEAFLLYLLRNHRPDFHQPRNIAHG